MPKERDKKIINIGLIGTGDMARVHARTMLEEYPGLIQAVSSSTKKRAQSFAKEFGIEKAYGSHEELLEDDSLDAVLIVSASETHAPLIELAAKKGKHIFCEKPLGEDERAVKKALQAVEKAGVLLQVGFNRRFDPHFARVKQSIEKGEIGQVETISIISRDPEAPTPAEMTIPYRLFIGTMIHDLDMARFLVGGEVESVHCTGGVLINSEFKKKEQVDTATATLTFKNGVIVVIQNSWRSPIGYDQRAEVCGSKKVAFVHNVSDTQVHFSDRQGTVSEMPLAFYKERYETSYKNEIVAFIKSLKSGGQSLVNGADGLEALRLALAARDSYLKGKPIHLNK